MEESTPQSLNGQLGSTGGISKQNENNNQRPQYSIPGILHFIQHEWAKFEMERSQWNVHRTELEVMIATSYFCLICHTILDLTYYYAILLHFPYFKFI